MTRSRDVADTQDNLGGAVAPFVAGRNKFINGDFSWWQRGTSFTVAADTPVYSADRARTNRNGSATVTITRESFAPGNAIAGYESPYFFRWNQATNGTGQTYCNFYAQRIEDVRTFAGQTVTLSFWAKADTNGRTVGLVIGQYFGTGGSTTVYTSPDIASISLTTSWVRYSRTIAIPSIAGKTIGTGEVCLEFNLQAAQLNTAQTIDLWGVQLEAGNVATPFTTASGSIGGELALCQRYYFRHTASASYSRFATVWAANSTQLYGYLQLPVPMRANPTVLEVSTANLFQVFDGASNITITGFGSDQMDYLTPSFSATVASGLTTARAYQLLANNSTSAYIAFGAEL